MSAPQDAATRTQYLVLLELGEDHYHFHAYSNALSYASNPLGCFLRQKSCYIQPCSDILEKADDEMMYVRPRDRKSATYKYMPENEDEEEDFGQEYEHRHPGTNYESDGEQKSHQTNVSPITTKAGECVSTIAFAAPTEHGAAPAAGGSSTSFCEIKSGYPFQLTVRTDNHRKVLYYDCFEFKRPRLDVVNDELPSLREIKIFRSTVDKVASHSSPWDSDDDEQDDEDFSDPAYDAPVEPREGHMFSEAEKKNLHVQAFSGAFLNSRVFRFRVALEDVVGARLQTMVRVPEAEGESDVAAVLVLEVNKPPSPGAFVARKISARYPCENEFAQVDDWTPNQIASKATRHYIYGNLMELKELAAHFCTIAPEFAKLMTESTASEKNTLVPPVSLDYTATPSFPEVETQESPSKKAKTSPKTKFVMTTDEVDELFREKGWVTENLCLKRAVLCGHIKIDSETSTDTVLLESSCLHCNQPVKCTIGDALDQACYGGMDYEDGGEGGAVKCEEEECNGMYITDLCVGNPSLDSGKFHNHCTDCPDFGVCIRDYRNAHCRGCGEHYFQGMSGFACQMCGAGPDGVSKSKPLKELPPPSPATWNGKIEGAINTPEAAMQLMANSMLSRGPPRGAEDGEGCCIS